MSELDSELGSFPEALRDLLKIREYREDKKSNCIYLTLEFTPLMLNSHGNIHGSYIAVLSITAAETAAKLTISEEEVLMAVSHSINFLKQPEILNDIELESCVTSRSDRIVHVSTFLRSLDTDIANSATVFVIEKL